MSFFNGKDIAPTPNADEAPYWAYCAKRELCFQRCRQCATVTHPPVGVCPACRSLDREWVPAPDAARVFSLT